MGYTINEDGTITRDHVPNTPNYSGGSNSGGNSGNSRGDNNSGCWILIVIGVIVGIIIAIASANKSSSYSSDDGYYDTDTVAVDSVEYYEDYVVADTAVADDYYYSSQSSAELNVSNSSISLSWEEQTFTINVYSTSSWWIDVNTDDWITLRCEGTQITMYVDSNPAEGSRHDYFVIKNDEGLTKRIDVYQE